MTIDESDIQRIKRPRPLKATIILPVLILMQHSLYSSMPLLPSIIASRLLFISMCTELLTIPYGSPNPPNKRGLDSSFFFFFKN